MSKREKKADKSDKIPYNLRNFATAALKPLDMKQRAWIAYLAHLRMGYSREAFVYREGGNSFTETCSYKTLDNLASENNPDFPKSQLDDAICDARLRYEKLGDDLLTGKIPNGNAAVFQIIMRNRFGYDKPQANMQISIEADFLKKVALIESLPTIDCTATKHVDMPSRNSIEAIEHMSNDA